MRKKLLIEKVNGLESKLKMACDNFDLLLKHLELSIVVEKHIKEPCPHERLQAFLSDLPRPEDKIVREFKIVSTKEEVKPIDKPKK